MNKSNLSSHLAAHASLTRTEAVFAVNAVLSAIATDEPVAIAGFGTFTTRTRAARQGRNPRTGERIDIPASKIPSFRAAKALREAVE